MSQHLNALASGQSRRLEIAQLRTELRCDPSKLRTVLLDPPAAVENLTVLDVLRLPRAKRYGAVPGIVRIGRRAAAARVSLLEPMGAPSSRRAREWAAVHALEFLRTSPTARRTA